MSYFDYMRKNTYKKIIHKNTIYILIGGQTDKIPRFERFLFISSYEYYYMNIHELINLKYQLTYTTEIYLT